MVYVKDGHLISSTGRTLPVKKVDQQEYFLQEIPLVGGENDTWNTWECRYARIRSEEGGKTSPRKLVIIFKNE